MKYDKDLFGKNVPPDYDAKTSDFWCTPPDLYPQGCFDPCPVNPTFDGLKIKWSGDVFCNPPYSQIEVWITKAFKEKDNCDSITMLLPNWTDRKWFKKIDLLDINIEFLQGRLKFTDPKTGAPKDSPRFGSMLVYLKRKNPNKKRKSTK